VAESGAGSWRSPDDYGRSLAGLSLNLLVADVEASLPFYENVLGIRALYHNAEFAALQGPQGAQIMLHADTTYGRMPSAVRAPAGEARGRGVEIRLMGLDPERVEAAAVAAGVPVLVPTRTATHGWRECYVADPNGYVFAVGVPTPAGT